MRFSLRQRRFVDTRYIETLTGRAYLANLRVRMLGQKVRRFARWLGFCTKR